MYTLFVIILIIIDTIITYYSYNNSDIERLEYDIEQLKYDIKQLKEYKNV